MPDEKDRRGAEVVSRLARLSLLMVAILFIVACGAPDTNERAPAPGSPAGMPSPGTLDPHGNFVLYVSNQSFARPKVDVVVEVDGQRVISEDFAVGDQHNWKRFVLRLSPGRHTLVARSTQGDATLRRSFVMSGKRWAVLDYWYDDGAGGAVEPQRFTFTVRTKPIAFA